MLRRIAVLLLVFASVAGSAFAQTATPAPTAVPVALTTTVILDGATDLIGAYGLTALILVGAFVGLAYMVIRRFRRAAM